MHILEDALSIILHLLDVVQKKAIKLIGNTDFTFQFSSLAHRRVVGAFFLFHLYFHGFTTTPFSSSTTGNSGRQTGDLLHIHSFNVEEKYESMVVCLSKFENIGTQEQEWQV